MKRLLSLVLMLAMICALCVTTNAEDKIIEIGTVDELKSFRDGVNNGNAYQDKTVKLTADIDLNGEENWTPIGSEKKPFKGTFDGGKHIIYNLKINAGSRYTGLFGRLENATVRDLGIEDAAVTATDSDAAILAGNAKGGKIECCYVTGNVKGESGTGGLLGSTHGYTSATEVVNCYARVTLDMTADTGSLSGISGWNTATSIKITNCYSACTGERHPIAGWSSGASVANTQLTNSYFDQTLSPDFWTGEDRGELGKDTAELKIENTFEEWDFTEVWAINPAINDGYPYLLGFEREMDDSDSDGDGDDGENGDDTHTTLPPSDEDDNSSGGSATISDSPQTFDAGIAVYAGIALTSAAGAVYVGKKKH